jgi:Dockerin type I domain
MKNLFFLSLIISFAVSAADFNVNTVADFRQALIDASNNSEHDTIHVAPGHYKITGSTLLYTPGSGGDFGDDDSGLTIQGEDASSTVLDGMDLLTPLTIRFITFKLAGPIEISRLEFRHGNGENGGGLAIFQGKEVTIKNSHFIENTAQGSGGGAYMDTEMDVNPIFFLLSAILMDNRFVENKAGGNGGGFTCFGFTFCTVTGNEFSLNEAGMSGGGAYSEKGIGDSLTDNRFVENKAGGSGGGFFCTRGNDKDFPSCSAKGNEFSLNQAGRGGGGFACNVNSCSAKGNEFSLNEAGGDGGGASLGAGQGFFASGNLFRNNRAGTSGGGLSAGAEEFSNANNNKFIGNRAMLDGGGAHLNAEFIEFNQNVLSSNWAGDQGGGVFISIHILGSNMISNTLINNESGAEGGGAYIFSENVARARLANNIIWGNKASVGGNDLFIYTPDSHAVSFFYNNLGQNANFVTANSPDLVVNDTTNYSQGSNIKSDPLLTDDFHLKYGSPAIDAGDNGRVESSTDFEGDPRIVDGNGDGKAVVDIGADEDARGDVNEDGCVDRTDADIILHNVRAGSEEPEDDINGDGVINRADARAVVRLFKNPGGAPCE